MPASKRVPLRSNRFKVPQERWNDQGIQQQRYDPAAAIVDGLGGGRRATLHRLGAWSFP